MGSSAFSFVLGASALISVLVKALEGSVPGWFVFWAERAEIALFSVDMFCFILFILLEAIKLIRGMWKELTR